jgi:hypothetical protein
MPLVVYCERGAFAGAIKQHARTGVIELRHGPYEGRLKRASPARPSLVTCDSSVVTADSTISTDDCYFSERYEEILKVIGASNKHDALHLDSAYKSGVRAFLTSDKDDIVQHRATLEPLLGLRIFHIPSEVLQFEQWVQFEHDGAFG